MFNGPLQIPGLPNTQSEAIKTLSLGAIGYTRDGRIYRYAKGGAADIVAGNLLVNADAVTNHVNVAVYEAAALNATKVKVTLGATLATANQYADGYLQTHDGAGEGYTYQIRGHAAADASGVLEIDLIDPLAVALTTASEVSLYLNQWGGLVISATDQADAPAGIAGSAVDVSEKPYFWVQTGGVANAFADEAYARGTGLTIGTGVAGQVEAIDATAEPQIGIALQAGVADEYSPILLQLN